VETIELQNVQVFDVLKNALNGELGLVLCVSGDRLDMRDKTGMVSRYKFGKHFHRVPQDQAVEFRARVRAARKELEKNGEVKPKRSRTVSAFLNKLARKR
jgi:hypothetical protein